MSLTNISVRIKRSRLPPQEDYSNYVFTLQEIAVHVISKGAFLAIVSYLFYDSFIAWILMLPVIFFSLKKKSSILCKRRKQRLEMEFKELILFVSSNLQAGHSVENAFREAYRDISLLFGKDSLMAKEMYLLQQKLSNNEQLENILLNLSKRSGVEDIKAFAEIFQIAKRSGGDICSIISNTAQIISDKQAVRKDIETVMSEKILEQKIMRYIPFMIIFYISITSDGYFEPLYHNILGWIIMTACMGVYIIACKLSDKILDIEI